jgi:hypothetical protein
VKDARGMLTIQNITGASDDHLNQAININAIPNLPYNSTDLKNKTLIYGPNLSHLKGKMVRMQPGSNTNNSLTSGLSSPTPNH